VIYNSIIIIIIDQTYVETIPRKAFIRFCTNSGYIENMARDKESAAVLKPDWWDSPLTGSGGHVTGGTVFIMEDSTCSYDDYDDEAGIPQSE
jgi:hypothetical protein